MHYAYSEIQSCKVKPLTSEDTLLVFELPQGQRTRHTKFEALMPWIQDSCKKGHNGIICSIPFMYDSVRMSWPQHRWKRLIESWKPQSNIICSCYWDKSGAHRKYRVLHSRLKTMALDTCLKKVADPNGEHISDDLAKIIESVTPPIQQWSMVSSDLPSHRGTDSCKRGWSWNGGAW